MEGHVNCVICNKVVRRTGKRQKYCKDCARKVINKKQREHRKIDSKKFRELSREYWQTHQDEKRKYSKKYYEKNKEILIEKSMNYAKKNNKDRKVYFDNYHNNKKFGGNRNKTLERDNYTCQICNSETDLVIHHKNETCNFVKRNNSLENLITLCRKCHFTIHSIAKTLDRIGKIKEIAYDDIIKRIKC